MSYIEFETEETNVYEHCPKCGRETNEIWTVWGVNLNDGDRITDISEEEFDLQYPETSGIWCESCGRVGWNR